MATYAIGDIQGCFKELQLLLQKIQFHPQHDRLWLSGDLINRGSDSLATLRFLRKLDPAPHIVLGNHDLHFLAVAAGAHEGKPEDTLDELLNAPDCDDLAAWLRQQSLLHHDPHLQYTMIHAGLAPQWDLALASQCAKALEQQLQSDNYKDYFCHMYGNKPTCWDPQLEGWDRLRFITNCLTRLRFCDVNGKLRLKEKGGLKKSTEELLAWFHVPHRANEDLTIVFGHWAALNGHTGTHNVHALDTGCVWGNSLTAMRLEDKQRFSVNAIK